MGADFARCIVDDENGDGDFRAEPLRALVRQLFQRSLPAGRKRQAMDAMLLVRAQRRLRGMRRQMRKSEAPMRHFLLHRLVALGERDDAAPIDALQYAVARRPCSRREAIRPARLRRLRQRDE